MASSGFAASAADESDRPLAGSTLQQGGPGEHQTWAQVEGTYFNVRQADYKRHPVKSSSDDSLYELVAVDAFTCMEPVLDYATRVQLPKPLVEDDGSLPVPSLFVMNCILPREAPSLVGRQKMDSLQVVMYFALKPDTLEEVRKGEKNSTKLFKKWVDEAPTDDVIRHTFKFIACLDNISDLRLGSFLEGYNGKPVLVTKSGTLSQGGGRGTGKPWYMEVGMNVHMFNAIARKAFTSVKDRIRDFDARVAFVIQGNSDDELPEQILGAAALQYIDITALPAH